MKRIILLFLVAALFSAMSFNSFAYNYATPKTDVSKYYNNSFVIEDNGVAVISVEYNAAIVDFEKIIVKFSLQRKLWNMFWVSYAIDEPNNEWVCDSNQSAGVLITSYVIADKGNYRGNFTIEFVNKNGSSEIYEEFILKSYN